MLNPDMKGCGIYELYRRQAEQLQAEQLRAAREAPGEATPQPGSMEWLAAKNKSS